MMKLHIEPVTEQNRQRVKKLRTKSSQSGFVESVQDCLQEAEKYKNWHPVTIYDENNLIGFAMYWYWGQYPTSGRVWLDRFLIDAKDQNYGYGTAILPMMLNRLLMEYHCDKIYLSVVEGNKVAAHLYQNAGFVFNGENVMVYQFKEG